MIAADFRNSILDQRRCPVCRPSSGLYAVLIVVCLTHNTSPRLFSAEPAGRNGTSDRRAREGAVQAIPWAQLPPQLSGPMREIVTHPSIYRRMPDAFTDCDARLHNFLLQNPDALVSIWQKLGITQLSVERISRSAFRADDGMGTKSQMHLVYASRDMHIYAGSGYYEGDLVPGRIQGRGVVILRSQVYRRPDGKVLIRDTMDAFIKIDSGGWDVVAKTIHPIFMKYADKNFTDTTRFVGQLHRHAVDHPNGTLQLIAGLPQLHPQIQQEFAEVIRVMAGDWPQDTTPQTVPTSTANDPTIEAPRWVVSRDPPDGPTRR